MLWLHQAVARQRGSGPSQRPGGGSGDQLPQHGRSYLVKTGDWEWSSPRAGHRTPKARSPRLLAGGHAAPTPAGNGAVAGPCPASARGRVRGAFCRGLSTVWGLRVSLGRLEVRSTWGFLRPRAWAGPQPSSLHVGGRVVVSEGPRLRHRHGRPLTPVSAERRAPGAAAAAGGVWGAGRAGGSAQGIVGESPPGSQPCEEGSVPALAPHPSARPPHVRAGKSPPSPVV